MILDVIENLQKYVALNQRFEKVVNFVKSVDINSLSNGRQEIDGEEVFVNIVDMPPKNREQARLETHNEMIDIQIVLSGEEEHGYTSRKYLPEVEYNVEDDISFYPGSASNYFALTPGHFVIYFPEDGHAPGINTTGGVHKAIFKVKK